MSVTFKSQRPHGEYVFEFDTSTAVRKSTPQSAFFCQRPRCLRYVEVPAPPAAVWLERSIPSNGPSSSAATAIAVATAILLALMLSAILAIPGR